MMLENNSITGFIPSQSQNIFFLENCMLLLWIVYHFLINFYVIVEANNYFVESAVSGTQQHVYMVDKLRKQLESQIGLNTVIFFFLSYEVKKKFMQINVSRHANVYMRLIYPALFNKF